MTACPNLRVDERGIAGVHPDSSCPDCHHRVGAHTLDGSCDVCSILLALAVRP